MNEWSFNNIFVGTLLVFSHHLHFMYSVLIERFIMYALTGRVFTLVICIVCVAIPMNFNVRFAA